ncbi:MAG: hypothetical protein OQK81_04250 [Candidatus Bathyarchaeota archaeon]|nr:hypothetical protein [Candidatus Bathyarchaeota archaeon]
MKRVTGLMSHCRRRIMAKPAPRHGGLVPPLSSEAQTFSIMGSRYG